MITTGMLVRVGRHPATLTRTWSAPLTSTDGEATLGSTGLPAASAAAATLPNYEVTSHRQSNLPVPIGRRGSFLFKTAIFLIHSLIN